jgi:hypothetical protein
VREGLEKRKTSSQSFDFAQEPGIRGQNSEEKNQSQTRSPIVREGLKEEKAKVRSPRSEVRKQRRNLFEGDNTEARDEL